MFRLLHKFQVVFRAEATSPNADSLPLSTNISALQNQWTILPNRWLLNGLLNENFRTLPAQLYVE